MIPGEVFVNEVCFAQNSIEKLSFKLSAAVCGTVTSSLTPSKLAAVSLSPASAPAAPRVTPPAYVPVLPLPVKSAALVPLASPSRQ